MKPRLLLSVFCFALMAGNAGAQTTEANMKLYASQYEQERVHIHFDKDAYLPGETVWTKAYILSGNKPTTRSKNIYFDWTDVYGNLLQHSSAPIIDGGSASSFVIPGSLSGAAVHLKVYTQWMLNFDSSFLYNKDIPVLAPWNGIENTPEKMSANIRFFPEGGELVNGLTSTVAFEIRDQHGRPVNARGLIRNINNQVLDSFYTVHDGMGSFRIQPKAAERYGIFWTDESGATHSNLLPVAGNAGAVLRIQNNGKQINCEVERTGDCQDDYKVLTLVASIREQVVYTSNIDLHANTKWETKIGTDQLKSGVVQFTLFDLNKVPFAERVLFVNNHLSEAATQMTKEMINLGKRGRNEITIQVPDSIAANLSVSVTDGGLGYDSSNNILADLLLNSEVRGYIPNIAYYFSNSSDSVLQHTDLLMLTHGWRRFAWQDLVAGTLPAIKYQGDADFFELRGKVTLPAGSRFDNSDSISLLLMGRDHRKYLETTQLKWDGTFTLKSMFFYDSVQIVYKYNHASRYNNNVDVRFETSLLPAFIPHTAATVPDYEWNRVPDVILDKESGGELIEIFSNARNLQGMNYVFSPNLKKDSANRGSETAAHYLQDNFPAFRFPNAHADIEPDLKPGKYASYSVSAGQKQANANAAPRNNINVSLDGIMVNLDDLKLISMKDILFIKILEKTNPKGLPTLSISSRQTLEQNNVMNNKTGFAIATGYTTAKEFYSPRYGGIEDEQQTDFRSTLYWNPKLSIDKNHHKVKLVFYNNDISNKLRIVVEGINKDGKITHIEELLK